MSGFLLGIGFWPLHRLVQKAVPGRRMQAFTTLGIAAVLVVAPVIIVVMSLLGDIQSLLARVDPGDLQGSLARLVGGDETGTSAPAWIAVVVPHATAYLEGMVGELGDLIARMAIGLMVLAFVLYYSFAEGPKFVTSLGEVLPLKPVYTQRLFTETRNAVNAIFFGQILISVVHGFVLGLGFFVFGIPAPFFWAFVTIIVSLLPVVGTPAVWLPAGAWIWVHDGPMLAIAFMVYAAVFSTGLVEHLLKFRLIGHMGEIHPLVVLLGVIGGVGFFGVSGFLFGPLILALVVVFLRVFATTYHEDENYLFL